MKDSTAPRTSTDQLVSSQWLDRTLPGLADVPEHRLLIAVLVDAVRCLQGGLKERAEVLAWIRQGHGPARLSFGVLCEGLGLEAEPLTRRLLTTAVTAASLRMRRTRGGRQASIGATRVRKSPRAVDAPHPQALSVPSTA